MRCSVKKRRNLKIYTIAWINMIIVNKNKRVRKNGQIQEALLNANENIWIILK
tara:strand:+ start:395 stop:553 length:159 start_codon:yes stop_codon:yes gene_type:complete